MTQGVRWCAGALVALALVPSRAAPLETRDAACALDLAAAKAARADGRLDPGAYPKATGADGRWRTTPATDRVGWTQGFFPGLLWLTAARPTSLASPCGLRARGAGTARDA
jgi:unsaturated chondroitin disaccharide hydrolase